MSELNEGAGPQEAAPAAARPDTSAMTDRQLARAVLDKTVRPRVADILRLAEAVLSGGKAKKAKGDKAERKLAKIPGQKKKKKKG